MFCNICRRFCCCCNTAPCNKGEAWTTDVKNWNFVKAHDPVTLVFDGFKTTENIGKSDDNTALAIRRSGCYDLEYLVNVSNFEPTDSSAYNGIEVYLTVNGNPISQPVRVDPTNTVKGIKTTVAADRISSVKLCRCNEISVVIRTTSNGKALTVTPSAWLDAYFVC